MEKIFFGDLSLEITRRCQLKCAHCLRGDAQDLDMSKEIIDSILDQTAGIFEVFFTGGEPTLNIEGMDYFLKEVIRRNIPLGGLGFITNGISIPDMLKDFLQRAYDYITDCRTNCEAFRTDATIAGFHRISIGISLDDFHTGNDPMAAKEAYEQFLPYESCDVYMKNYRNLLKIGRAKDIKGAVSCPFWDSFPRIQIGIAYKGHTPVCGDSIRITQMLDFCDAYVPCRLCISAKGKMAPFIESQSDYFTEDEKLVGICQYRDGKMPPIMESILSFNQGAQPCYVGYNIPLRIESDELFSLTESPQKEKRDGKEYFDPLYLQDIETIASLMTTASEEYSNAYSQYLTERVSKYSDKTEFLQDFPYSNDYFYQKVMQEISGTDAQTVAQWIIDNKDYCWYRVDDSLVVLAKGIVKKIIVQEVRDAYKGLWHPLIGKIISYEFEKVPYLNE